MNHQNDNEMRQEEQQHQPGLKDDNQPGGDKSIEIDDIHFSLSKVQENGPVNGKKA